MNTCTICKQELVVSWTDTHGVAQCQHCGHPYLVYEYDDYENPKHRTVLNPPRCLVKEEWIETLQRYWNETQRPAPSEHSFPGSDQEIATNADAEAFYAWARQNAPKEDK